MTKKKELALMPTDSQYTMREIKQRTIGHFFDDDVMKFFGDTLKSFKVIEWRGITIFYRKPGAMVNVFGEQQVVTKDNNFFNAWKYELGKITKLSKDDISCLLEVI